MKKTQVLPDSFITLDEEGYFLQDEMRLNDQKTGYALLKNMAQDENGAFVSNVDSRYFFVEVFDEPLIAQFVSFEKSGWQIICPYETLFSFNLNSLRVDEWDRFHGRTKEDIPFVFSRKAQMQFFNLLEEFDDDSITWEGKNYPVQLLLKSFPEVDQEKWWSDVYVSEGNPRWNLAEPAEALKDMLPRLKLPKSRILVLGCGEGHDAAFFAQNGHIVTGIDVSPEAIKRAKKNYAQVSSLKFEMKDIFSLGSEYNERFDYVFEHTCYCAINPVRRQELVKIWNRVLAPGGHLMGVFFGWDKPQGPPFGGSEWELRQRLNKNYEFIFWGRWRHSLPRRQGREFFVFAKKKTK